MKIRRGAVTGSSIAALASTAALLIACSSDDSPVDPGNAAKAGWIDRLEVVQTFDAYGGMAFGTTGAYQVIGGIVHGRLNPNHAANADIADIKLAPVGTDGMVAYSTDFVILRPKAAANAKRTLLYSAPNLGRWNSVRLLNDGPAASNADFAAGSAGNGFLMRQGYTMVFGGFQGTVAQTGTATGTPTGPGGALGTTFPVARNADGSDITGVVRQEFIFDNLTSPVTAVLAYEAASITNRAEATLDWRQTWVTPAGMTYNSPSTPVAASDWEFVTPTQFRLIARPAGADAGSIYSLVYRATKPMVMGIGFAAIRDLVTFLRYDARDAQGNANPLSDLKFDIAMMEGASAQPGPTVKTFLREGFNDDARGGKVFDAMLPYGTGGRLSGMNSRWGNVGESKQHEGHWQPGDQGPFGYSVVTDAVSGASDGIFRKCLANGTCPKVIQADNAHEFWAGRASLVATNGSSDVAVPADVRLYLLPGARHDGAAGPGTETLPPQAVNFHSSVATTAAYRALLVALDEWATKGTLPPPSRWPTIASGTLADPANRLAVGFPDLSAAFGAGAYNGIHNELFVTSYANAIPVVDLAKRYPVLAPTTDADGNEKSGVRLPDVSVPLATYTGWNPRRAGSAAPDMCGIAPTATNCTGSTLRFAANAAARAAAGDPRLSVTERYTSKADYIAKVKAAADALVSQRLLLQEDVQRYVDRATTAAAATELP